MSYKETYKWNPETGEAMAILTDTKTGKTFLGEAICHPDDKQYMSEYTGIDIADMRARLNILRDIRDSEIKPQLKIMKHLYCNMKTNKLYNPKSYEARMVRRQYHFLQGNLKTIQDLINEYKTYIKSRGNVSAVLDKNK